MKKKYKTLAQKCHKMKLGPYSPTCQKYALRYTSTCKSES